MTFGVFSIYDAATLVYSAPFVSQTNESAMRTFGDAAKDNQTNINKHPADFSLFRVGTWDDDNGKLKPEEHFQLARGTDYHDPEST